MNQLKNLVYILLKIIFMIHFLINHIIYVGKFLKHFKNIDIVAVKTPSFIKEVNYSNIIDILYNSKISDNKYEDTFIKKQIANVNIGLLEKGNNKKVESFLCKTEEEAEYYRSSFGGKLHLLQHLVQENTLEEDPLNYGLDMDKSYITKTRSKKEGNPYNKQHYKMDLDILKNLYYNIITIKYILLLQF